MIPHRPAGLVRHLGPGRLVELTASLDSSSSRGLRDRAVILCLARLRCGPAWSCGWRIWTGATPPCGCTCSTTSIVACSLRWGVHDLGAVGAEVVTVRSFGDRSGSDHPAGDLRLPGHCASEPSTGSTVALCNAKRGSRGRSARLRAFTMEPNTSSPPSMTASIPEIRGDPSARTVAIVLCRCASNSARTRRANSASARLTSRHAVTRPRSHRSAGTAQVGQVPRRGVWRLTRDP
jgi:hypothetical protein